MKRGKMETMEINAAMVKTLRDQTGAGMMECKAALKESNCETDFVARTEDFQALTREIAMHVAAASPQYVRREDVPADLLEKEKAIYRGQMEGQNKPAAVIDKIVEGKLNSFYEQVCLLDQPSIRDPKVTIGQAVQAAIAKMGENISVARFVRFKLGEGV